MRRWARAVGDVPLLVLVALGAFLLLVGVLGEITEERGFAIVVA